MRRRWEWFPVINNTLMVALILVMIYPFYFVVVNSFNALMTHRPSFFWPEMPTLINYMTVMTNDALVDAFFVSTARTVIGTALTLTVCASCAYVMSKKYFRFRAVYLILFTIPNFFSGGAVPAYLNIRNLGLLDTFWVYVLASAFSFFYMVMLISAYKAIPESLEEAALIDGAGILSVFMRIVLPVTLPTIATVALYAAVSQWNAWHDTLYYTNSNSLRTLSSVLMRIVRENNVSEYADLTSDMENRSFNPEGVKMATMIVSTLPILFVYPFLQRYFVKGIMIGSIKG